MLDRIINYGSYVFCDNGLNYIMLDGKWISTEDMNSIQDTAMIVPIEEIRAITKKITKQVIKANK